MAEVGEDVLLLEADLRKESEFRGSNGQPRLGLSTVLSGVPLDDASCSGSAVSAPATEEPRR